VLRAGLYIYEPFDESLSAWADTYTVEVMARPEETEEPKARRAIFKRKVPAPQVSGDKGSGGAEAESEMATGKPGEGGDPLAGFDFSVIKTFADALAVADGDYEIATDLLRRAKEARAK